MNHQTRTFFRNTPTNLATSLKAALRLWLSGSVWLCLQTNAILANAPQSTLQSAPQTTTQNTTRATTRATTQDTGLDAASVFARVQKQYSESESMRVQFSTSLTADGKKMRGVLLVKRGNQFQLDLAGRVITCNGKTVWNYDKAAKKVIVSDFKNSPATMSPEKLFLSFPKNYKPTLFEQSASEQAGAASKLVLLTLKPANQREAVAGMSNVTMLLDPTTLKLHELNVSDDATVYQWIIHELRLNAGLKDTAFEFAPPKNAKNVSVVDLRE